MVSSLRYLAVGRILGAHGVRGEVKVQIHTDVPERFRPDQQLYLESSGEWQPVTILGCRFHQGNALLFLQGYSAAEFAAE